MSFDRDAIVNRMQGYIDEIDDIMGQDEHPAHVDPHMRREYSIQDMTGAKRGFQPDPLFCKTEQDEIEWCRDEVERLTAHHADSDYLELEPRQRQFGVFTRLVSEWEAVDTA